MCPNRTLSEELYHNFRPLLEGALSECCATLRYAIDARVAVDTESVPGLHWPIFVPGTRADWTEFESGTWTMNSDVDGDYRSANVSCSFSRRDTLGNPLDRYDSDTAARVTCEREYDVRIIEDGERNDWDVVIRAGYTLTRSGSYRLEIDFSAYRQSYFCDYGCERYWLDVEGTFENLDLTDLGVDSRSVLRGGFEETQTSASTGAGVYIEWDFEGRFTPQGALEVKTVSGGFSVTDTLSLCP